MGLKDILIIRTTYKTNEIKITLTANTIAGWEEIDAVQLLDK